MMETGIARYGPVRRVVWGPAANYRRLPDSPSVFHFEISCKAKPAGRYVTNR